MSAPSIGSNFAGGLILPQGKGLLLLFLFYSKRGACALDIPGKLSQLCSQSQFLATPATHQAKLGN